jgi:hypothetical protein
MKSAAPSVRRARAAESFGTAAEAIGPVEAGMAVFAVTRGQFSMIDAILAVLDGAGPASISVWTWTVADYEVQCLERLRRDGRITAGRLVIDVGARTKNAAIIDSWRAVYGEDSVRLTVNHSKIATVESASGLRVLLRGSMNLNFNPRFEQLDVTEGGPDFALVKRIESELPAYAPDAPYLEVRSGARLDEAFDAQTLALFGGVKVWRK